MDRVCRVVKPTLLGVKRNKNYFVGGTGGEIRLHGHDGFRSNTDCDSR